jgi:hypothetical protein
MARCAWHRLHLKPCDTRKRFWSHTHLFDEASFILSDAQRGVIRQFVDPSRAYVTKKHAARSS